LHSELSNHYEYQVMPLDVTNALTIHGLYEQDF